MTGIEDIIRQLENQKAAIERALAALREVDGTTATPAAETGAGKSVAAKSRRSEGQKKRWAAKQTAQSVPTEERHKGGMTSEGRQKLADAMKRRWGVKRAATQKPGRKKAT